MPTDTDQSASARRRWAPSRSEDPIDTVEGSTLEEVGALGADGASMLTKTFALALLKLARIPPGACSVDRLYETLKRSKIEHRSKGIAGTA